MADRIKGIIVEIGGDTTGLQKSLETANRTIKNTQGQLKDVNKLLKMDPTSTELLTQKRSLLNTSIDETKKKLKELQDQQDKVDEALKNGDISQDQYNAWQREIINTEQDLKNLQKELRNTDNTVSATLKEAGAKMKDVGGKITGVGEGLTKSVSTPIAAVGAASLAAFHEVDTGMDLLVTKTGASGEALESMEKITKDIATSIPTTFETAGTAVGEVSTRFHLTGQALQDLSTQFIEFASINNTDVSTSVANTQKILSQFGMDASEAGNVLGLLTATGQQTGISVDDLSSELQTNGATFKEMGLNAADSITLMGNFEKAGIDSDSMLTGLKKAATSFSKSGKDMDTGLSDLISRLQNSSTQADATAEAYKIFGSKAGLAFVTAAQEGRLSLQGISTDLSGYSSTVDQTYQGTLDGVDSMQTAMNALKEAGAAVGDALGNTLAPILQKITDGLKEFSQWFTNLSPETQDLIIKIALVAAAVGPVLILIGQVISAIGTITVAIGFLVSPMGLIILAIAAVVAGILYLYNTYQPFHDFVNNSITVIVSTFTTLKDALVTFFTSTLPAAFASITSTVSNIVTSIQSAIQTGIDFITSLPGKALQWGEDFINGFISGIKDTAANVGKAVGGIADTVAGWLHFSKPDVGPLKDYESWMPDFMAGLATSIESSRGILQNAMKQVSGDLALTMNPTYYGNVTAAAPQTVTAGSSSNINLYIDGIHYNTDDYIDSSIDGFVKTMVRKSKMYSER